jgi:hypothetical protein
MRVVFFISSPVYIDIYKLTHISLVCNEWLTIGKQ